MTTATSDQTADDTSVVSRQSWARRVGGFQGRNWWYLGFVAPFVVGLAFFVYVPIIWSAYLSFYEARGTTTPTRFVGIGNYRYLLADPTFRGSIGVFVVFMVLIVPLTYVCSLGLALLLNSVGRFQAFFRSVFFIPTACSYVVAAMVWRVSFFNGAKFGLVNSMLRRVGLDDVDWLSGATWWYWPVVVSLRLWLQVGFYMILIIAGLNKIPTETYEAAAIDGATGWRTLRHITLPQLRTTTVAVLMLLLIGAFQAFDEFYNLFGSMSGYPPFARPPLVHLYIITFGSGSPDLGLGGAGTMIVTALIVLFGLLQNALVNLSDRRGER